MVKYVASVQHSGRAQMGARAQKSTKLPPTPSFFALAPTNRLYSFALSYGMLAMRINGKVAL